MVCVHGRSGRIAHELHRELGCRGLSCRKRQRPRSQAEAHRRHLIRRHLRRRRRIDLERGRIGRQLLHQRHVLAGDVSAHRDGAGRIAAGLEHRANQVAAGRRSQQSERREIAVDVVERLHDVASGRQAADAVRSPEAAGIGDRRARRDDLDADRQRGAQRRRRVVRIIAVRLHHDVAARDRSAAAPGHGATDAVCRKRPERRNGHGVRLRSGEIRRAGIGRVSELIGQRPDLPAPLDDHELVLAGRDPGERPQIGAQGERFHHHLEQVLGNRRRPGGEVQQGGEHGQ